MTATAWLSDLLFNNTDKPARPLRSFVRVLMMAFLIPVTLGFTAGNYFVAAAAALLLCLLGWVEAHLEDIPAMLRKEWESLTVKKLAKMAFGSALLLSFMGLVALIEALIKDQ